MKTSTISPLVSTMDNNNENAKSNKSESSSSGLSPSEYMIYLQTVVGLDSTSANAIYRGERMMMQKKGRPDDLDLARRFQHPQQVLLENSLQYYGQEPSLPTTNDHIQECFCGKEVMDDDSLEHSNNIMLDASRDSSRKELVNRHPYYSSRPHHHGSFAVKLMEVAWKGSEDFRTRYVPDPDECARRAAIEQLDWSGQHCQVLTLVRNEMLGQKCDAETEWEHLIWGKAVFRVKLAPPVSPRPLDWQTFQTFEKVFGPTGRRKQEPSPPSKHGKEIIELTTSLGDE